MDEFDEFHRSDGRTYKKDAYVEIKQRFSQADGTFKFRGFIRNTA